MSPHMQGQHTTAEMVAVGTSADASTHSMSKKKKAKRNKTHPKLPPLVIRRPCGHAEEPHVVAGKHTLSPEEGPSNTEEREVPKPAKRAKAGLESSRPPPLELTDDEDDLTSLGHVLLSTSLKKQKAIMSHSSMGKTPLRRTETLLMEDRSDFDDSSSLDNNILHSSEVETSDYESGLSDDDLVGLTSSQMDQAAQKMAFENILQRQVVVVGSARPQLRNVDKAEEDVNVPSTIKTLHRDLDLQHIYVRAGTSIEGEQAGHTDSLKSTGTSHADSQHTQVTAPRSTTVTPDISTNAGHPKSTQSTQVLPVWPEDTDLVLGSGKLCLTDQTPIVQATISESFELLHALIMMKHAFPDLVLANKLIEEALSTAALQVPNAEDIHVRILQDHGYCLTMSALVGFYAFL
ncbi:hypothetical protein EI94DRAFT_1708146 [Lactarius quietus]|nr:hypothetical protein EI94DRAFT_1708146 [Lactarius quietus]